MLKVRACNGFVLPGLWVVCWCMMEKRGRLKIEGRLAMEDITGYGKRMRKAKNKYESLLVAPNEK